MVTNHGTASLQVPEQISVQAYVAGRHLNGRYMPLGKVVLFFARVIKLDPSTLSTSSPCVSYQAFAKRNCL